LFTKTNATSLPLEMIYNSLGPPSAWSSIFYISILVVCILGVFAIPLPGYLLPFEKPPYFNFIFYKNGFWVGMLLNSLDHLIMNCVTNVDNIVWVKYGVLIGGGLGGIGAMFWWWLKAKKKNN
jgi:hypothetical protein